MKKSFSGWLTRESSGYVYFHTQKPYCVKNTREDSRDNKAIVTHQWFTGGSGEAFCLGNDDNYPVTVKNPIPATMELIVES